jgi:hypothetical protein
MDGRARHTAGAAVTEAPTVCIDLMHDHSAFIGSHLLSPATPFWHKAVATALKQGRTVKTTRLEYLLRDNRNAVSA